MNKSIYLDWNVFQDIIQERRNFGLKENLFAAKKSGYVLPYSCSHMRDLARCSNQQYIENDLNHLSQITSNWCVGLSNKDDELLLEEIPPKVVLQSIQQENQTSDKSPSTLFGFPSYKVDTSKISDDNILIPYIKSNDSKMTPKIMEELTADLYEKLFDDYKLQKKFRNSLSEIIALHNPAFRQLLEIPLYKYLLSTKEEIVENLEDIANSFLSISGKSLKSIPVGEKITTIYNILDFFPAFSEKLKKKNNIKNISTDAEHTFLASSSRYFICGDNTTTERAKIIYKMLKIKTKVYETEIFLQRVIFK